MLHRAIRVLSASTFALLAAASSFAADNFWVSDGKLMRGTKPFTVRAVNAPELSTSTAQIKEMVPAFVRVTRVGANALWFDLPPGLLDANPQKAVEALNAIASRAKDTRLAIIVRVVGPDGDEKSHRQVTEQAAQTLKNSDLALYWFDGPDAAKLAKAFNKLAPKCCVIAPENGDLRAVTEDPAKEDAAAVLIDKVPAAAWGETHCILRGGDDATLNSLDAAMTRPEEKAAYTPDNTLLTEEERKEGFESLFNGKDLSGWWFYGKDLGGFKVTPEGTIAWIREGGGGLISRKRYKDFILRYEYKLAAEGNNSGVYIRAPRQGRQSKLGMEFQALGDFGKVPDKNSTGSVYDVVPPKANGSKPAGEWNSVEIDFRGPKLKATLNGVVVQDISFEDFEELKYRNREGFIGLQDHNCPVQWRNIRIKELN